MRMLATAETRQKMVYILHTFFKIIKWGIIVGNFSDNNSVIKTEGIKSDNG
jgi:hypothetical protein